jgi:hypothetical protein
MQNTWERYAMGRDHSGDQGVDGRIILQLILDE